MSFAFNAAVAGVGTVSCAGTTTVTGTGTTFATLTGSAPGLNHARVGGTITVAGVTKTIVAIASTTSLTTDTAFGTFTNSAFTVQTGVTQTGTDTMDLSLGLTTGFNVTNRGDLMRTFDVRGNDLYINGTLIVDSTVAQLRNNGSCNNRIVITGSASGGELRINGRKSVANNGPFPYPGFDWLGTNGLKIMALDSTNAAYPAKLTLIDACIRYGADWFTTYSGNYSRITTQGSECWILCAKGTGTSQARLRQDNTTASIDFQATKTWVGVWLNFGVPQVNLTGYTPIYTDGPEINLASVPVATRITIENYNTTYVTPAYYPGVQLVLLGGAYVRVKNNLKGSDLPWRSMSPSGRNVVELSKQVKATAKDATGNLLSDGYFYFTPVGSNVAGIRGKGMTSDITFDLSKKALPLVSGSAETEYVYAWDYSNSVANESTYEYFCSGTTKGAETHPAFVTRYGYDTQPLTMTLSGNGTFEGATVHASLPTTDKVIGNAAAITGVTFNFTTKTWTNALGSTRTVQEIYDAYQYQRNVIANLGVVDDCVTTNGLFNWVGWTGVNNGTITAGSGDFRIGADTITNNGTISAIYLSGGLTSTRFEFRELLSGAASSVMVFDDATDLTKLFINNPTDPTQTLYLPPSATATTLTAVVEYYGKQRETLQFPSNVGGVVYLVPKYAEDVGITETNLSTVLAYTQIENDDKWYDRTAAFRLTEQGIKVGQIATRNGTAVDTQAGFSIVIDDLAASVYSLSGSVFTLKSDQFNDGEKFKTITLVAPATLTAADTELINANVEDAVGNSSVTLAGGDGDFELWKITTATVTADYATGTKIGDFTNEKVRFIGVSGFDLVGVDINSNIRRRTSMSKGVYTMAFYVGDQIQLAQAPQVIENGIKLDLLQTDIDDIKGTGFTKDKHSLTKIWRIAKWAASVASWFKR